MLGTVDREHTYRIADALAAGDGPALLAESDALAARGLSGPAALEELATLFHRVAIAQAVPGAVENFDDASRIAAYAKRFTPESVQLAYQICVQGRADLAIAPDEATGFAMTLLRLLAFEPVAADSAATPSPVAPSVASSVASPARATPNLSTIRAARVDEQASVSRETDEAVPRATLPDDPAAWPGFVAGLQAHRPGRAAGRA